MAEKGSLLLRQNASGNGQLFVKLDNGSSTNWQLVPTDSADANRIEETLKNDFVDSPYQLMTPSIFADDGTGLVSSATATYAADTAAYTFTAPGNNLISVNLFDPQEFLDESKDIAAVRFVAFWRAGLIDPSATYEVSRDGGLHYFPVDIARVGDNTEVFYADYEWDGEEFTVTTVAQNANTGTTSIFNATTTQSRAQAFSPSVSGSNVSLQALMFKLGTPTGNFRYALYTDVSGLPGVLLTASAWHSVAALTVSPVATPIQLTYDVAMGTTYHMVIETDATYKASYSAGVHELRMTTTTTAGGFALSTAYNGTLWASVATTYFNITVTAEVEDFTSQITTVNTFVSGNITLDNATRQKLGIPFTVTNPFLIKRVRVNLNQVVLAAGYMYTSIVRDVAGNPSTDPNDVIVESVPLSIVGLGVGVDTQAMIDLPHAALPAGNYHVVLRTDDAYKNSGGTLRVFLASPAGNYRQYNGTVWSTAGTLQISHTIYGRTLDLRVRITGATASAVLDAFAVMYDQEIIGTTPGIKNVQAFSFQAVAANLNEFQLTSFVPDPDLLVVYHVEKGRVYKYGAFGLQGGTIVFPVNAFYNGGVEETVTLVAQQLGGSTYDNSDLNALLLASNHLGSPDATIDRSIPGRGIFLRRPDGVLMELALNNANELELYSV